MPLFGPPLHMSGWPVAVLMQLQVLVEQHLCGLPAANSNVPPQAFAVLAVELKVLKIAIVPDTTGPPHRSELPAITSLRVPPKNMPQHAIMSAIRVKRIYSPCVQELLDLAFYAAFIRKYIASFTAM